MNIGGGFKAEAYDEAWGHGVRLIAEPFLFLLVGLSVENPRRVFHWAMGSLVATSFVIALYGIAQSAPSCAASGRWTTRFSTRPSSRSASPPCSSG